MKLALTMEKPIYGGDCLAHGSQGEGMTGKAVFVPLTLPGESVSALVTEQKRNFARAEAEEVLIAAPGRVAPPCPYFGACGGCHYQHAEYALQLSMKRQILYETLERAGVRAPGEIGVLAGEPWGYRNRIRLAIADGKIGYRGRRSHAMVPVSECPIAAPGLLATAWRVAAYMVEEPWPISEMEFFANPDESQMLVSLFCAEPVETGVETWLDGLKSSLGLGIAGIRMAPADGALNPVILAESGEPSLIYPAAGFGYRVDAGAFFQVNRRLVDAFVELVTGARAGKLAWDLFAGVGLFARRLAARFEEVIAVESAPASLAALEHNLKGTSGRAVGSTTLDFLRRNRAEREARPELIVLDPPRAGLGEETVSLLNAIHAPEMVYVSCDPATLARDLRTFTQERYRIERVTLVDMFPQTFHLETMVELRRC